MSFNRCDRRLQIIWRSFLWRESIVRARFAISESQCFRVQKTGDRLQ